MDIGGYRTDAFPGAPEKTPAARFPVAALWAVALYVAVNCHNVRRLSGAYYAALVLFYAPAIVYAVLCLPRTFGSRVGNWYGVYFAFSFIAIVQTFFDVEWESVLYGAGRMWMTAPLALIAHASLRRLSMLRRIAAVYVVFVLIGVASLVYQYAYGPLSWFVEAGERAGGARFGSFLGNITALSAAIPLAVLITLLSPSRLWWKAPVLLAELLGAVLTFSKHAIAGTLAAAAIYLFLNRTGRLRAVLCIAGVVPVAVAGYAALSESEDLQRAARFAYAIFSPDETSSKESLGGAIGMDRGIAERIIELPSQSLNWLAEHRGGLGYVIGGGMLMAGAVLLPEGVSPYYTAHNTIVDFFVLGGPGLLVAFIGLAWVVCSQLARMRKANWISRDDWALSMGLTVLFLASLAFGGGLVFQPVVSALWWILVGLLWAEETDLRAASDAVAARGRARSKEADVLDR